MKSKKDVLASPVFRRLKGYAFDPSLSLKVETVKINEIMYAIPWEDLRSGPIGEYIEVIDFDPTVGKDGEYYSPVDLDHPYILADNGLPPSESNPQFHQQMVYAVAMCTITHFENALGRKVIWAPRLLEDRQKFEEYVPRLRIYPHALRDANAFYSPHKKALLFGYFTSSPADEAQHLPGSLVFTCLSHDIIAHETTHAILDGMQRYYNEPTNPDVLAFHEAFSDIVALFQHFTFPEVIKHQIAQTRGDFSNENLLLQLAHEFGAATGRYGSLRDALGTYDKDRKKWRTKKTDITDYQTVMEPHARGGILVAAVFDAFISIYNNRIADLKRIASNGSGILPRGELHPDLVEKLSEEAAKTAEHVLYMCIRALDYCPPVDITFGEFLRALITADSDIVKDDNHSYRLSFIDAFRNRGIYPERIRTLSVESLSYGHLPELSQEEESLNYIITKFLRKFVQEIAYIENREEVFEISKKYISGHYSQEDKIYGLHRRLQNKFNGSEEFLELTGVLFSDGWEALGINTSEAYGRPGPSVQVQNLRLVSRVGPDGNKVNQILFSIVQRCGVIFKKDRFERHFQPDSPPQLQEDETAFEMRGGSTLIYDLETQKLKYSVSKPLVVRDPQTDGLCVDRDRMSQQYEYMANGGYLALSDYQKYFNLGMGNGLNEPFFLLHQ